MEYTTDPVTKTQTAISKPENFYTEAEVKAMGGLGVFTWLASKPDFIPQETWNLFCHCDRSGRQFKGWGYDEDHNWWFHIGCGLPKPNWGVLFECDNCETWFRTERVPERNYICPGCRAANQ